MKATKALFAPSKIVSTVISFAEWAGVYDDVDFGEVGNYLSSKDRKAMIKKVRREKLWEFAQDNLSYMMQVFGYDQIDIKKDGEVLSLALHEGYLFWIDNEGFWPFPFLAGDYIPSEFEIFALFKSLMKRHFDETSMEKQRRKELLKVERTFSERWKELYNQYLLDGTIKHLS